jgi:hypothetical protein
MLKKKPPKGGFFLAGIRKSIIRDEDSLGFEGTLLKTTSN